MAKSALYVCDLDGTLLRPDATLSDFARHGLNELLTAGIHLTLASSRGTPAMRALLAGVDLELPVIELNGAFVSEWDTGRHLAGNVLSSAHACEAVEIILETGADPIVSAWDGSRDRVHFGRRMNDATRWYVEEKRAYGDPRLTPCDDLQAAAKEGDVASVVGFLRRAEAAAAAERLRLALGVHARVESAENYYCPGWVEIQAQHRRAEKGAAIPALLEACDAAGADVIACGDHLNDLGLFAAATHSVAPANAHPRALEIASVIVGANDEDGVVRHLLERHGLRGAPATHAT